jgi:hypothetical protein
VCVCVCVCVGGCVRVCARFVVRPLVGPCLIISLKQRDEVLLAEGLCAFSPVNLVGYLS